MTTTSSEQHFRRTKKPVHPKKLAARKALHALKDAGIDILDKCDIHEDIYFIVNTDRSIIDDIIHAASNADWKELALWNDSMRDLRCHGDTIKKIKMRHRERMVNIRAAAPHITNVGNSSSQYWQLIKLIDGINKHLPFGTNLELIVLLDAALLYKELYSSAMRKKSGYYSHWDFKIDRTNIDDVVAIARNIEEAKRMQATFFSLNIYRGQQISNIIEAGSIPLSAGVL